MQLRTFTICLLCVAIAAGLFFVGSTRLDDINTQRAKMKLVIDAPLENAPPSLAFATVALGAFRGLLVDILWIRADQLKEEGKFFDAKQLAEWMTILQPRFASVWDFHAWNMAYNISVAIPATRPQERWQWVKNGFELLRDEGVPKNPTNIKLYHSLAWIFQHKIGGITDDAHKYYKLQIYNAFNQLIGSKGQDYYIALAESPKTLDKMLEKPEIVNFLNELTAADETFADSKELVNNYIAFRLQPQRFSSAAFDVINNYRSSKTLEIFDTFARANYLRNTFKMEPQLMAELNEKYGPISYKDPNEVLPMDWRHPDSHAIYWASLGLKMGSREDYDIDEINTDRIVFHSLQNLYRKGKMIVYESRIPAENDPCNIVVRQSIFQFPDLRMFDRYDTQLRDVIEKYTKLDGNVDSIKNGHRNMLKRAVMLFYQSGDKARALEIYNTLRKEYPEDKDMHASLTDYLRNRLISELSSIGINDAREMISMMLKEAYFRYAVRDDDEAAGREQMARQIYDYYQKEYDDESVDRVILPDYNLLRYIGITSFMSDYQYPEYIRQNLMDRIQIEQPQLFEKLKAQHEEFMQQLQQQEGQSKQQ